MSILDKISGRFKKAAGDLADDPSLRREGAREERKGEAKEELADAHERGGREGRGSGGPGAQDVVSAVVLEVPQPSSRRPRSCRSLRWSRTPSPRRRRVRPAGPIPGRPSPTPSRPTRPSRSSPRRRSPTLRARTRSRPPGPPARPRPCEDNTRPPVRAERARRVLALLVVDGPLQLGLVHLRAAVDAELLGLVVELVAGPAARAARARALAAAAAGGDVLRRGARGGARLAGAGALLVDRARRDLLGARLEAPRDLTESLIASYWRSRLVPFFTPRGGIRPAPRPRTRAGSPRRGAGGPPRRAGWR